MREASSMERGNGAGMACDAKSDGHKKERQAMLSTLEKRKEDKESK